MTDNVVPLQPKDEPPEIIVCADCKCATWFVTLDGAMKCPECLNTIYEPAPEFLERCSTLPKYNGVPMSKVTDDTDDMEFERRRLARVLQNPNTCVVVLLGYDGQINTWKEFDGHEDWIATQLGYAKELL